MCRDDLSGESQVELTRMIGELARGIAAIVPSGFDVSPHGLCIAMRTPNAAAYFPFGQNLANGIHMGLTIEEAMPMAVTDVLDQIQDEITVCLGMPWPRADVAPKEFAELRWEIKSNVLSIWFETAPGVVFHHVVSVVLGQPTSDEVEAAIDGAGQL